MNIDNVAFCCDNSLLTTYSLLTNISENEKPALQQFVFNDLLIHHMHTGTPASRRKAKRQTALHTFLNMSVHPTFTRIPDSQHIFVSARGTISLSNVPNVPLLHSLLPKFPKYYCGETKTLSLVFGQATLKIPTT